MNISIQFFGHLTELATADVCPMEVNPGATVQDVVCAAREQFSELSQMSDTTRYAINAEYCQSMTDEVHDGDLVAFLPPVSGG